MGIISSTCSYSNVDTQGDSSTIQETYSEVKRNKHTGPNKIRTCRTLTTEDDENFFTSNAPVLSNYNKRVSFANAVEKRTFIMEDEVEVKFFDGLLNANELPGGSTLTEEQEFQEMSFESSENKFVIEDNFYKFHYKLNKKASQISWIKQLPTDEKDFLISRIDSAIIMAHEKVKYPFHRVDGMIVEKKSKKLVIVTDFFLIDFTFTSSNYEVNRIIEIKTIDFITLARSGNTMILHLVPIYRNNHNINHNYVLSHKNLEGVVWSLTSSYFYDKPINNKIENIERQISVIIVNDKFEIFNSLQKIFDFIEYRNVLTDFLEERLDSCNLPNHLPDDLSFKFKYTSIKYRINEKKNLNEDIMAIEESFMPADFIITRNDLYLLNYNPHKRKFELIQHIEMRNLIKLILNKSIPNCFVIFDKKNTHGLEVKSESYSSLLSLIDELYEKHHLNHKGEI